MRNYGIDLYRIVLTYMICVLHTLGQGGLLGSCEKGTIYFGIFWFLEACAYCAVDGYALISGYNAKEKSLNYTKLITMWFQVFFYSCILSFVVYYLGFDGDMSLKTIVKSFLPASTSAYWYFSAYLPLCILEPFVIKGLNSLSDDELKVSFVLIILIFSFSGSISDAYKTGLGYSFVWLLLLFVLGYAIKRLRMFDKVSNKILILISLALVVISWLPMALFGIGRVMTYSSPTTLFIAIMLLNVFSRLKPKEGIVKILSPLTFGVYLCQNNRIIWNNLKGAFIFVKDLNVFLVIPSVLVIAIIIYIVCSLVDFGRSQLFKLLRINELSSKLNSLFLKTVTIIKSFIFSM